MVIQLLSGLLSRIAPMMAAVSFFSPVSETLAIALLAGLALLGCLIVLNTIPLSYNVMNLTVRWRTTLMTGLAFVMVVGLLVTMLSFVNGMIGLTESSGQPGNVLVLAEGATDESFSSLGFSDVGDIEKQPFVLTDGDRPFASRETYLLATQLLPKAGTQNFKRRFLQIRGFDDPELGAKVHGMSLLPGGEWFSKAGVRSSVPGDQASESYIEVVLGDGVSRLMAGDRTPEQTAAARNPQQFVAGDTFTLGDRTWYITGIMKPTGSTFDSEVWAKRSLIGPLFGKNNYSSLVLRTAGKDEAKALKTFLAEQYKKSAISANVETEYYSALSQTNQQFTIAIIVISFIMSIGGCFGITNTMFAAISQRSKDIGVLRLLGYGRLEIMISFLLESLLLALFGGLLGCAIGMLADGWTANSVLSSGPGGGKTVVLELAVTVGTLGVAMLTSLLMGLFGGLLPSLLAMRVSALEALR
jgi:putative ABC transport system permease protein